MPTYVDPSEPVFAEIERRDRWFPNVLLAEYGELAEGSEIPNALNWLNEVPVARRYDFEDVECGMVYVSEDGGYACSVWDVSGADDDPWAVFVVDPLGARLLPAFSILDEKQMDEEQRTGLLKKAADAIPDAAVRGEFTRTGEPLVIPDWLLADPDEAES
jgi:hypothetical protein